MNGAVRIYIGCATAVGIVLYNEYSGQAWHVPTPPPPPPPPLPAVTVTDWPLLRKAVLWNKGITMLPLVEAHRHSHTQTYHKTPFLNLSVPHAFWRFHISLDNLANSKTVQM